MDVKVAKVSALARASMLPVIVDDREIVLINSSSGVISALEDRCSHSDVKLSEGTIEGSAVECPAHGAKFDVGTGKVLCMPAISPVKTYKVTIVGDDIIVTVPD